MPASLTEQAIQTLEVTKNEEIAAPVELVFEAILRADGSAQRNTRWYAAAHDA